jgi:hypothetical protein
MNIGITGHQDLVSSDIEKWVADEIETAVDELVPTMGISCLAAGADQIFANILVEKAIPLIAVIPSTDYSSTFTKLEDLEAFDRLNSLAERRICLDFSESCERAFLEAGQCVVDMSDLLIAVWNGRKSGGLGGTADIVAYAKTCGKAILHIDISSNTVKRIGEA